MRHAKSPAQQKKERRKRRAYEAAEPGTPPVYGTGWPPDIQYYDDSHHNKWPLLGAYKATI